ncbi:YeiH family protein [Staphylococcus simulans]|uniref:YeiH family protein n=1 Tax=Staphylococcus simulans TaxID=1286 RepID=UPI001E3A07BF|nr:YeiH family protein [Staphylococcus simulans]MCD8914713.1 YeiH family protein [Staphylococcus simulans]
MKVIRQKSFAFGIIFTLIIALISMLLAQLPLLENLGALTIAILFAIVYRHLKGYPESVRSGIEFSAKRLLKVAIVLYGLKLNINEIITQGRTLLLVDIGVVIFSIGFIVLLNKWMKGDKQIGLLLGIGTGICGAAAIAATSSILKSKEKDTALSVGIIALIGTLFSLVYTVISSIFHISPELYGAWSGSSLHEIAHVVLAAGFAGEASLKIGLLAKLGRVFLLIPVSLILLFIMKFKSQSSNEKAAIEIPYFLIGFVIASLINTYLPLPEVWMSCLNFISTLLIIMAMVGLGLNVAFKDIKDRAGKPLIAIVIASLLLSVLVFITLSMLHI